MRRPRDHGLLALPAERRRHRARPPVSRTTVQAPEVTCPSSLSMRASPIAGCGDPLWPPLTAERDVVRLDLRGFGESAVRPHGALSPVEDVLDTLAELGIRRCHLVGASFGAGVAVEVALTRPEQVDSLLLSAPGGSLIADRTPRTCVRSSRQSAPHWPVTMWTVPSRRTWLGGSMVPSGAPAASTRRSATWSDGCSGGRWR